MSVLTSNTATAKAAYYTENCYCDPIRQELEFGAYYLDVGRDHYAVCALHNAFRWVGRNLFSSWRHMTDADFRENAKTHMAMKPLTQAEAEKLGVTTAGL
jgi:hypothetical protein